MAVYPPQFLNREIQATIAAYTEKLALGLNCVGMMNIQFVISDNKVYVIEVNPRASRTVPFLSKVTGIPMAQIATKAILGEKYAIKVMKMGYIKKMITFMLKHLSFHLQSYKRSILI